MHRSAMRWKLEAPSKLKMSVGWALGGWYLRCCARRGRGYSTHKQQESRCWRTPCLQIVTRGDPPYHQGKLPTYCPTSVFISRTIKLPQISACASASHTNPSSVCFPYLTYSCFYPFLLERVRDSMSFVVYVGYGRTETSLSSLRPWRIR